jgi:hypothetical protein
MESRNSQSSSTTAINSAFDMRLSGVSPNPAIRAPHDNIVASACEFRNFRVRIPLSKVSARKLWCMPRAHSGDALFKSTDWD